MAAFTESEIGVKVRSMRKATVDGIVIEHRTNKMRVEFCLYETRSLTEILRYTQEGTLQTVDKDFLKGMMKAIHADKRVPLFMKVTQYDSNNNEIQDLKMVYPNDGRYVKVVEENQ
jgi:hypothetical protein